MIISTKYHYLKSLLMSRVTLFFILFIVILLIKISSKNVLGYTNGTNICNNNNAICYSLDATKHATVNICNDNMQNGQIYYYRVQSCQNDTFHSCLSPNLCADCFTITEQDNYTDTTYTAPDNYNFPASIYISPVIIHLQLVK